jgi:hypothetical protein
MAPFSAFTALASVVVVAGAARLARRAETFYRDMAIADGRMREDDAERAMLATQAPERLRTLLLSAV